MGDPLVAVYARTYICRVGINYSVYSPLGFYGQCNLILPIEYKESYTFTRFVRVLMALCMVDLKLLELFYTFLNNFKAFVH